MWLLALLGIVVAQTELQLPYNWLSLAALNSSEAFFSGIDLTTYSALFCPRLLGLNPVQQLLCKKNPIVIQYVARGIRDALYHCQDQFKNERWNCSDRHEVTKTDHGVFRDILATKEGAFLNAIATAGIVYEVTKGCSTGNLSECGCDTHPDQQKFSDTEMQPEVRVPSSSRGTSPAAFHHRMMPRSLDRFSWGGCSDNVPYGVKFSKEFLDEYEERTHEKDGEPRHLVHKHNFFVGREQISQNIRRQCRCHGVSGSCEFKTCWLTMPKFGEVAAMLKKRYDHFAVQVELDVARLPSTPPPPPPPPPQHRMQHSNRSGVAKRVKKRLRRKEKNERKIPIRGNELTYMTKSPSYCERNNTLGILGTVGRMCSHRSHEADDCDLLCCGRGYNTKLELRKEQCHCKFVWCCNVKCKECIQNVTVHTCK